MFCKHCGIETEKDVKFCQSCGKSTLTEIQTSSESVISDSVEPESKEIIKCGNCEYIGPGKKSRRLISVILAWLVFIIAWPITVLYFIVTSKYECPKCHSTFLGVKNKDGVFTEQKGGAKSPIMIVVWVLLGIAIVGILSGVIITSLSTAREKAKQAQEESMNNLNR